MSCSLLKLGNIQDLLQIKKFLIPHLLTSDEDSETTSSLETTMTADWGDGWEEWSKEVEDEKQQLNLEDGKMEYRPALSAEDRSALWLQECYLSLSPANDLMVLAYDQRAVFLAAKWESVSRSDREGSVKYHMVHRGEVNLEERERVSAVLCIPLASQRRSSQGGPDWTCVLLGFTSGYVRIYTESGALLLSQLFHQEPVIKFKCHTGQGSRPTVGATDQAEELTILYPRALVAIDGFSLFQALRACRNQLARATAIGNDNIQPPSLAYKKWGLRGQDKPHDHVSCGMSVPSAFEQMQTASVHGGFYATLSSSSPISTKYITTGIGPFIGFYYALEGGAQPILADVALAVAHKLKRALFSAASGWLSWNPGKGGGKDSGKGKPKVEPATPLDMRFSLPDLRRHGESIYLSPGRNLAATTDSFGRVVLIDVNRGIAVRMWKGYRDAQCGWIQVAEEVHSRSERPKQGSRLALFLVIYAPRRGILEVWNTQQGPRVAAFNVSKNCRLLSSSHGMMGLSSTALAQARAAPASSFQCCLMEPDGEVRTIHVPFHFALTDKNSKRAADLHLLKKLNSLANNKSAPTTGSLEEEMITILMSMKVPSLQQQGLEKALHCKQITPKAAFAILKTVEEGSLLVESDSLDGETRFLQDYCKAQHHLLDVYMTVQREKEECMDTQTTENPPESEIHQILAETLHLTPAEVDEFTALLTDYRKVTATHKTVQFKEDSGIDLPSFLRCFKCSRKLPKQTLPDEAEKEEGGEEEEMEECMEESEETLYVTLNDRLPEELRIRLGNYLYHLCLQGMCPPYGVKSYLQSLGMEPKLFLILLIETWLHGESQFLRDLYSIKYLYQLMLAISELAKENELVASYDQVSTWWQSFRDIFAQSSDNAASLVGALVTRSVAITLEYASASAKEKESQLEKEKEDSTDPAEEAGTSSEIKREEWIAVSLEFETWNLLIRQLHDVLALATLIKSKIKNASNPTSQEIAWMSTQESGIASSSRDDLQDVSVRRILTSGKDVVALLVSQWTVRNKRHPYQDTISHEEGTDHGTINVEELLLSLRKRFPCSLDPDVLNTLQAWEYAVNWNKHTEITKYLEYSLEYSLEFLTQIRNDKLQHGVACMLWNTFIVRKVSATTYLMEKVGKAPKDRLCRKEIGLSDGALGEFLDLSSRILDIIYQTELEAVPEPYYGCEELWQGMEGPTSIVDLATTSQAPSNYYSVDLHKQLCTILHAIMTYSIKSIKPLSLFDGKEKNTFFRELSFSGHLSEAEIDVAFTVTRQKFLLQLISAVVCRLPTHQDDSVSDEEKSKRWAQARQWLSTAYQLGRAFAVNIDLLRRQHVYELYSSGHDSVAQEVLSEVSEHSKVGPELLNIAGKRVAYIVNNADATNIEILSRIPPSLVKWLKSLAANLRCPSVPLSKTSVLVDLVLAQLQDNQTALYSTATQLSEAITALN